MSKDRDYFGYKKILNGSKQTMVNEVFSKVFRKYDLMNDLMSFGAHRLWKKKIIGMIPKTAENIIDMAAGTGDISIEYIKAASQNNRYKNIVLSDINHDMLSQARVRLIDNGFLHPKFFVADATNLPFADDSFDCYIIAFGIRNIGNMSQALKEVNRVLRKGGKFLCLELSPLNDEWYKNLYDFYSFKIIPMIGGMVANSKDSYQYLVESIRMFPKMNEFEKMIQNHGFRNTGYESLTLGVAAIHYGYK